MARQGMLEVLAQLQASGFADLAGTRMSADIPVAERLINEVVAASIPPNVPVSQVAIHPESGNEFSVRLTPRTSFIPPVTLKLAIEQQPELPHSPILALRMKTMGGLFGFATAALPIANMLPPGVRLDGERILVDLRAMAAHQGLAHHLRYLTQLRITTEAGRVIIHVNAAV